MKVLFLHQAYPAQFRYLAPALAARGDDVRAMTAMGTLTTEQPGVTVMRYQTSAKPSPVIHPWAAQFETQMIRGEAVFRVGEQLKAAGYSPDVVIAHPSWGESLFVKSVWPDTRLGLYLELYHATTGLDMGFDTEFSQPTGFDDCITRMNNAVVDLNYGMADGAVSPTRWQADSFPPHLRALIDVIHEGVDTDMVRPNPQVRIELDHGVVLTREDEVVTFVNRNLEPLRGWHIFARALPELLARRPRAHVVIIGGDQKGYGHAPTAADSWKQKLLDEVRPKISDADWARVHFMGRLPYAHHIALLQLSWVHVYLTYPYVLSWSLVEAMSAGCAIVASDTGPVREAIEHGETGRLVDFFDVAGLTAEVCRLLDAPEERARLSEAVRAQAVARYDRKTVCLPLQIAWVDRLAGLKGVKSGKGG